MKALSIVFLLCSAFAFAERLPSSPADPAEIFIQSFQTWHQGKRSETQGEAEAARESYQQADELLQLLESKFPEWNKEIVAYRAGVVPKELKRLGLKEEARPVAKVSGPGAFALEPDQIFLSAYTSYQAGEKLEGRNAKDEALERYRESGDLLELLRQRYSDWNPSIVKYRAGRVAEALARLK